MSNPPPNTSPQPPQPPATRGRGRGRARGRPILAAGVSSRGRSTPAGGTGGSSSTRGGMSRGGRISLAGPGGGNSRGGRTSLPGLNAATSGAVGSSSARGEMNRGGGSGRRIFSPIGNGVGSGSGNGTETDVDMDDVDDNAGAKRQHRQAVADSSNARASREQGPVDRAPTVGPQSANTTATPAAYAPSHNSPTATANRSNIPNHLPIPRDLPMLGSAPKTPLLPPSGKSNRKKRTAEDTETDESEDEIPSNITYQHPTPVPAPRRRVGAVVSVGDVGSKELKITEKLSKAVKKEESRSEKYGGVFGRMKSKARMFENEGKEFEEKARGLGLDLEKFA